MATKIESDYPSPPPDDGSDAEEHEALDSSRVKVEDKKPVNNNVSDILKRLQSSGALLKKPKEEYRCFTCDEDYPDSHTLNEHLLDHVSLPSIILEKLSSDDEDLPPSDDNWSDDEEAETTPQKTPQKIDISQLINKTGLTLKKNEDNSNAAINKLSGLGFTIKKGNTPIKQEKSEDSNSVLQKIGNLGGLKLKLKSEGNQSNSFKVVDGLKDFKTSEDEDEGSGNDDNKEHASDSEGDQDKIESSGQQENDSEEEDGLPLANKKIANHLTNLRGQKIISPIKVTSKPASIQEPAKTQVRPTIKQTPKRGPGQGPPLAQPTQSTDTSTSSTPERRESQDTNMSNVVVKQETDVGDAQNSDVPLFSGQIKSERSSPPIETVSTPLISRVKSEVETPIVTNFNSVAAPLLPVTKKEEVEGATIIEINGDSNDEDDDCCVVSATPAPDIKPVIPKTENIATPMYPPPTYPTSQSSYTTQPTIRLPAHSTEKQHSFNWNAPDSKSSLDLMDKSADAIFESLLSSASKKENISLSEASEYISLDTLGPQHSCEVCNTRFTDISLLEEHKRMTGHSSSLVMPSHSTSTLLPYNPQSNILSSLLPVKQLAEQVGKLGPGFTHQQNVMINIQAYPGSGSMGPPQPYNTYPGQNMAPGYGQPQNNMFGSTEMPGQGMPGQYPGAHYMGNQSYGQQYQPPMSKPNYPGSMPTSPFSTASPLQSMQQAVYNQSTGMMNNQMGQMGPPGSSNNLYIPSSSPSGVMKPPGVMKIQNIQTFAPGQPGSAPMQIGTQGQQIGSDMGGGQMSASNQGQMPPPGPIRMAPGATISGSRPRMPAFRGPRPSLRPGVQVHGHVRAPRPRMPPSKRPVGMPGGPSPKKRPDMLLPGKHDNEDCHVMAMQKQRDGMPLIQSVQGAKDKINLGSQISVTKKVVNKQASAMANVLASRGISIKQKQKSRSPSPERPIPHIPNLGAGVSIKHSSKSSNFSIPEAKVGGGMQACKICKKMFMNQNSLMVHMSNAHPQSKLPVFKCDECPASYPKMLQLQHHKRTFHNTTGHNRELGLPVVDLSQDDCVRRLSGLGIFSYIPLANREQPGGCFGIPIISVHNMQNGSTHSLQALGADGLLSLGPLKPLPNT